MSVMAAVLAGDAGLVQSLLSSGHHPDLRSKPNGEMPIHRAAKNLYLECVKLLLDNPNAKTWQENTPLIEVCGRFAATEEEQRSQREIIDLLVERGADVNAANNMGSTPFTQLFSQLYEIADGQLREYTDDSSSSAPPSEVFAHVDPVLVRKFVDLGVDVNKTNFRGESVLHLLTHAPVNDVNVDLFNYLLSVGVSNKTKDHNEFTVLHKIILRQRQWPIKVIKMLIEAEKSENDQKNYVNMKVIDGATPLYFACQKGRFEVVELLLSCGANPNIATNDHMLPIHPACQGPTNKVDIVRRILPITKKKVVDRCNLKAVDDYFERNSMCPTPFHLAISWNFTDILELLLESDLNSDCLTKLPGKNVCTPLTYFINLESLTAVLTADDGERTATRIVRKFLAKGARLVEPDPVFRPNKENSKLLLKLGCGQDPWKCDTPLQALIMYNEKLPNPIRRWVHKMLPELTPIIRMDWIPKELTKFIDKAVRNDKNFVLIQLLQTGYIDPELFITKIGLYACPTWPCFYKSLLLYVCLRLIGHVPSRKRAIVLGLMCDSVRELAAQKVVPTLLCLARNRVRYNCFRDCIRSDCVRICVQSLELPQHFKDCCLLPELREEFRLGALIHMEETLKHPTN